MSEKTENTPRRQFLKATAGTVAAVTIVPRHVLGCGMNPPSEKLNIAGIGAGGMGAGDIDAVSGGNNIVALCDVDLRRASAIKKFPGTS